MLKKLGLARDVRLPTPAALARGLDAERIPG